MLPVGLLVTTNPAPGVDSTFPPYPHPFAARLSPIQMARWRVWTYLGAGSDGSGEVVAGGLVEGGLVAGEVAAGGAVDGALDEPPEVD